MPSAVQVSEKNKEFIDIPITKMTYEKFAEYGAFIALTEYDLRNLFEPVKAVMYRQIKSNWTARYEEWKKMYDYRIDQLPDLSLALVNVRRAKIVKFKENSEFSIKLKSRNKQSILNPKRYDFTEEDKGFLRAISRGQKMIE